MIMKKSDKKFLIEKLKDFGGLVIANNKNKLLTIQSLEKLTVELVDYSTGKIIDAYSCDCVEDVVDSLIDTYKSFKIDYELCI